MRHTCWSSLAALCVGLTSAHAADLPPVYKGPAPQAVVHAHDWTGVYVGLQGGYGWGESSGTQSVDGFGPTRFFNATADVLASVRGRAGWTAQNWLLYATGGVAFGHVETPPLDS